MIVMKQKGDFRKITKFVERARESVGKGILDKYGAAGVAALASATPKDSGETATSWYYVIEQEKNRATISFRNSNIIDYVPIAVILQYGHATKSGGWVEGRDYINPVIQPIFDDIADSAWREVIRT